MSNSIDDDAVVDQKFTDIILSKARRSPFLTAGLASLTAICAYGAYNFRKRDKKLPTQLYIIQLRVAAQGTVIACLTAGMVYHMIKKHVLHDEDKP